VRRFIYRFFKNLEATLPLTRRREISIIEQGAQVINRRNLPSGHVIGRSLQTLLILVGVSAQASGSTVVLGNYDPNQTWTFPFGSSAPGGDGSAYQQVYSASAFPEFFAIRSLRFKMANPAALATGYWEVNIGATNLSPEQMDSFGYNISHTNWFYNFWSGTAPRIIDGYVVIPNFAGVGYVPAIHGNLMIEIRRTGSPESGPSFYYQKYEFSAAALFNSAHNYYYPNPSPLSPGYYGIVTEFSSEVTPEPGTVLLLGGGLAGFLLWRRRATRASRSES
jgi:hypothetical protein